MPLTLIQGHYRIVHAAPDGDSIKFYPNNPDLWQGMGVRTNHAGGAQLRLDGIDALETHYQPKGGGLGMLHQPAQFAQAASAALLTFLGFKKVVRGEREIVTSAQPEQTPGFILTRFADTRMGAASRSPSRDPPAIPTAVPSLWTRCCCAPVPTIICWPRVWPIPPTIPNCTPTCAWK